MLKYGDAIRRILAPAAFAALLVAGAAVTTPASAQYVSCGDRQAIMETLKEQFSEGRTAYGITADGRLLEVFSGPSGSWTLLLTQPGGKSCLVSSGEGWRHIRVEPQQEPLA